MTMAVTQSKIWWIFLLQGIAGIALGLLLVTEPGATTLAIVTFLGFYWLIMGIFALVRMFVDQSVPWIWSLLVGIVGVLAGLSRHQAPAARRDRHPDGNRHSPRGAGTGDGRSIIGAFRGAGIGSFILGVFYVLIALLLLAKPVAAAIAVPLVFGVLLLVQGAALVVLALRARA